MFLISLIMALAGIAGMIWMAVIAFSEGETWWGVGCVLLGAIIAPIYGLRNFEICQIPTILCFVGFGGRIALRLFGVDS